MFSTFSAFNEASCFDEEVTNCSILSCNNGDEISGIKKCQISEELSSELETYHQIKDDIDLNEERKVCLDLYLESMKFRKGGSHEKAIEEFHKVLESKYIEFYSQERILEKIGDGKLEESLTSRFLPDDEKELCDKLIYDTLKYIGISYYEKISDSDNKPDCDFKDAILFFERCLKIDSKGILNDDVELMINYALCNYQLDNFLSVRSICLWIQSITTDQTKIVHWPSLHLLILATYRLFDFKACLSHIEFALSENPNDSHALKIKDKLGDKGFDFCQPPLLKSDDTFNSNSNSLNFSTIEFNKPNFTSLSKAIINNFQHGPTDCCHVKLVLHSDVMDDDCDFHRKCADVHTQLDIEEGMIIDLDDFRRHGAEYIASEVISEIIENSLQLSSANELFNSDNTVLVHQNDMTKCNKSKPHHHNTVASFLSEVPDQFVEKRRSGRVKTTSVVDQYDQIVESGGLTPQPLSSTTIDTTTDLDCITQWAAKATTTSNIINSGGVGGISDSAEDGEFHKAMKLADEARVKFSQLTLSYLEKRLDQSDKLELRLVDGDSVKRYGTPSGCVNVNRWLEGLVDLEVIGSHASLRGERFQFENDPELFESKFIKMIMRERCDEFFTRLSNPSTLHHSFIFFSHTELVFCFLHHLATDCRFELRDNKGYQTCYLELYYKVWRRSVPDYDSRITDINNDRVGRHYLELILTAHELKHSCSSLFDFGVVEKEKEDAIFRGMADEIKSADLTDLYFLNSCLEQLEDHIDDDEMFEVRIQVLFFNLFRKQKKDEYTLKFAKHIVRQCDQFTFNVTCDQINMYINSLQSSKLFSQFHQLYSNDKFEELVELAAETIPVAPFDECTLRRGGWLWQMTYLVMSLDHQKEYVQCLLQSIKILYHTSRTWRHALRQASTYEEVEKSSDLLHPDYILNCVFGIVIKCLNMLKFPILSLPDISVYMLISGLINCVISQIDGTFRPNIAPWSTLYHVIDVCCKSMLSAYSSTDFLIIAHEYMGEIQSDSPILHHNLCSASSGSFLTLSLNHLIRQAISLNGDELDESDGDVLKIIIQSVNQLIKCYFGDLALFVGNKHISAYDFELDDHLSCLKMCEEENGNSAPIHNESYAELCMLVLDYIVIVMMDNKLPEFDSYKSESISSDMFKFLLHIKGVLMANKIKGWKVSQQLIIDNKTNIENYFKNKSHDLLRQNMCVNSEAESQFQKLATIYYLLADFEFKNSHFESAIELYCTDLGLKQDRLDSWVALALTYNRRLDELLNSCNVYDVQNSEFSGLSVSVERCYEQAHVSNVSRKCTTVCIESASFAYSLYSYFSYGINLRLVPNDVTQLWKNQMVKYRTLSRQYYEQAVRYLVDCDLSVEIKNSHLNSLLDVSSDESWLLNYMLGKLSSKELFSVTEDNSSKVFDLGMIRKVLNYFTISMKIISMQRNGSVVTRKVSYNAPSHLSVELIEVYFKTFATILKLESHILDHVRLEADKFEIVHYISKLIKYIDTLTLLKKHSIKSTESCSSSDEFSGHVVQLKRKVDGLNSKFESLWQLTVREPAVAALELAIHYFPQHFRLAKFLSKYLLDLSKSYSSSETGEISFAEVNQSVLARQYAFQAKLYLTPSTTATRSLRSDYQNWFQSSQYASSSSSTTTVAISSVLGELKKGSNNNIAFFLNLWRSPVQEFDRPGSYHRHVYKCMRVLISVCSSPHILDSSTLFDLWFQLKRHMSTSCSTGESVVKHAYLFINDLTRLLGECAAAFSKTVADFISLTKSYLATVDVIVCVSEELRPFDESTTEVIRKTGQSYVDSVEVIEKICNYFVELNQLNLKMKRSSWKTLINNGSTDSCVSSFALIEDRIKQVMMYYFAKLTNGTAAPRSFDEVQALVNQINQCEKICSKKDVLLVDRSATTSGVSAVSMFISNLRRRKEGVLRHKQQQFERIKLLSVKSSHSACASKLQSSGTTQVHVTSSNDTAKSANSFHPHPISSTSNNLASKSLDVENRNTSNDAIQKELMVTAALAMGKNHLSAHSSSTAKNFVGNDSAKRIAELLAAIASKKSVKQMGNVQKSSKNVCSSKRKESINMASIGQQVQSVPVKKAKNEKCDFKATIDIIPSSRPLDLSKPSAVITKNVVDQLPSVDVNSGGTKMSNPAVGLSNKSVDNNILSRLNVNKDLTVTTSVDEQQVSKGSIHVKPDHMLMEFAKCNGKGGVKNKNVKAATSKPSNVSSIDTMKLVTDHLLKISSVKVVAGQDNKRTASDAVVNSIKAYSKQLQDIHQQSNSVASSNSNGTRTINVNSNSSTTDLAKLLSLLPSTSNKRNDVNRHPMIVASTNNRQNKNEHVKHADNIMSNQNLAKLNVPDTKKSAPPKPPTTSGTTSSTSKVMSISKATNKLHPSKFLMEHILKDTVKQQPPTSYGNLISNLSNSVSITAASDVAPAGLVTIKSVQESRSAPRKNAQTEKDSQVGFDKIFSSVQQKTEGSGEVSLSVNQVKTASKLTTTKQAPSKKSSSQVTTGKVDDKMNLGQLHRIQHLLSSVSNAGPSSSSQSQPGNPPIPSSASAIKLSTSASFTTIDDKKKVTNNRQQTVITPQMVEQWKNDHIKSKELEKHKRYLAIMQLYGGGRNEQGVSQQEPIVKAPTPTGGVSLLKKSQFQQSKVTAQKSVQHQRGASSSTSTGVNVNVEISRGTKPSTSAPMAHSRGTTNPPTSAPMAHQSSSSASRLANTTVIRKVSSGEHGAAQHKQHVPNHKASQSQTNKKNGGGEKKNNVELILLD